MVYNGYDEDVCLLVTKHFPYIEIISYVGWLTKHQNDDFNKKNCYHVFIVIIVFRDPENFYTPKSFE